VDSAISERKLNFSTEMDVRGERLNDAVEKVTRYIDDAVMAGLNMCYIIHGKGTGKLRAEIHGMLRHDKRIKAFRLGEYGEGDSGVTVAEFK
jgi:DNA mismatch repair protein MutS2